MGTAMAEKVHVPAVVYEGLQAILEADEEREVNKYHHTKARRYAFENDYFRTATWIKDHPREYSDGLQAGFVNRESDASESPEEL